MQYYYRGEGCSEDFSDSGLVSWARCGDENACTARVEKYYAPNVCFHWLVEDCNELLMRRRRSESYAEMRVWLNLFNYRYMRRYSKRVVSPIPLHRDNLDRSM